MYDTEQTQPMTQIFWPGTRIARSTGNAFTAHQREATTINWAGLAGFGTQGSVAYQKRKARESGEAYKRPEIELAPKPQMFYSRAGMP